jgi:hypothetical protein
LIVAQQHHTLKNAAISHKTQAMVADAADEGPSVAAGAWSEREFSCKRRGGGVLLSPNEAAETKPKKREQMWNRHLVKCYTFILNNTAR